MIWKTLSYVCKRWGLGSFISVGNEADEENWIVILPKKRILVGDRKFIAGHS